MNVWTKGHRLTLAVYRAAASELEYHLLLAHDLGLPETSDYEGLTGKVIEVKRMLTSFILKLRAEC